MAATGCVSESSSTAAEFTTVRRVTSDKYDPFKHLLSWDEKQSLFKWKGSLEELQDFSSNVLELDVSPTKCITDRSSSLKSKLVTLVLYNSTGTLQIQGPESISIKTELRKLLKLPDDENSVMLLSEDEAAMSQVCNGHEKLQDELDLLKSEVRNILLMKRKS